MTFSIIALSRFGSGFVIRYYCPQICWIAPKSDDDPAGRHPRPDERADTEKCPDFSGLEHSMPAYPDEYSASGKFGSCMMMHKQKGRPKPPF
jgi:hypothetical protein